MDDARKAAVRAGSSGSTALVRAQRGAANGKARQASANAPVRKRAGKAAAAPLRADELRNTDFCEGFKPELVAMLARECVREHYAPGTQIIGHTSPGKDVFLLLTGRARVAVFSGGGREVTYDVIEPGETIGELAAIDGQKRSASVLALDEVTLARIPRSTFTACMLTHPSFAFAVARRLARTVRWMSERVQEFQGYDALGRVCAELLRQCGGRTGKPFVITSRDLASRVGARRDHVARILPKLKRMGLIKRTKDSYEVLDIAGLKAVMQDSLLE